MINNEEDQGKGRSAKCPRERLKFQIFPTVVVLLVKFRTMALTGQMLDESAIFTMDTRSYSHAWETLWSSSANRKK